MIFLCPGVVFRRVWCLGAAGVPNPDTDSVLMISPGLHPGLFLGALRSFFADILGSWGRLSTCLVPGGARGGEPWYRYRAHGLPASSFRGVFWLRQVFMLLVFVVLF